MRYIFTKSKKSDCAHIEKEEIEEKKKRKYIYKERKISYIKRITKRKRRRKEKTEKKINLQSLSR